jgi:hypothetical protein
MRLIKSNDNNCVAASIAMVFNLICVDVQNGLLRLQPRVFPFKHPYAHLPKVASMEQVCEWAADRRLTLMPFPRNPMCSPHPDCPAVPVWDAEVGRPSADDMFDKAMRRGPGLLEGLVGEKGHMVAWDGNVVFDPRGYCYSLNVATDLFDFVPTRFWLAGPRK